MYGGELPLVEVHIEHAAHLAGVLHTKGGQGVKLFCCDGLPAEKHSDKFVRCNTIALCKITAQLFPDRQQLLAERGLEVPLLPALRHMVGGAGAGCFFLRAPRGILRVDLGTDAFVLTLRELVAKLIQHIFQMLL